jgi:hypothetical protein
MMLEQLLSEVWRRRWRILLLTTLLYAAAGALIWNWPRSFTASAIVAPAETTGIATSTLLSPGSLMGASLLDSRPTGNFAIYLAALRSPEAAMMLARDTPLLAHLSERRARGPIGEIRRTLGWRIEADLDDAISFLDTNLAPTASLASVTWTLELVHRDRAAALDMLGRLHRLAEAQVREGLAGLAAGRIALLERRLAAEPDLFLRQALLDLLAQQQRAALVVLADEAVAARLVSPPMVEIRPSTPNRPLLLVLLAVAAPGLVLVGATAAVLVRAPVHPAWPAAWPPAAAPRRREPALAGDDAG